jgi:hypothetical protein
MKPQPLICLQTFTLWVGYRSAILYQTYRWLMVRSVLNMCFESELLLLESQVRNCVPMARTNYFLMSWREQITFWYHGENKLLFVILARTNYFLLSWQEQITFWYHGKNKLLFDDICFALDQHAELDFHSSSSLKQHHR